jgi:hypothetical protein
MIGEEDRDGGESQGGQEEDEAKSDSAQVME